MRSASVLITTALVVAASTAHAQPGTGSIGDVVEPRLSAEEQELLDRGEISPGAHGVGVFASIGAGLGLGQLFQNRWTETGWIVTLGEGASLAVLIYAFEKNEDHAYCVELRDRADCGSSGATAALIGGIGFAVFRVFGIVDAAIGPGRHNRRVRAIRARVGESYLTSAGDDGAIAGIRVRF